MSLIEQYQQQIEALAVSSAAQVAAIYVALQAGQVTEVEAGQLITSVVAMANAGAATLADAYVSVQIETGGGIPTPSTGLIPADDTERLTQAVATILDERVDTPEPAVKAGMRFDRLARAEPLETAQRASIAVMDAQPMVEGWTRQLDGDPCQLCRWWWREGRIWPKNHPFQSHKGCNCQPKVVLSQHIKPTEYTKKSERNQA